MNRDDLKAYSGGSVQILLDGKEEAVTLNAENPEKAFLELDKTSALFPAPEWTNMGRHYLTDDDIAGLIPNGPHNLFSRISLTSPPPSAPI